ncbi:MAG: regulatory protein RecX [Nevskiaceae bacterium]|nr:MAG: regulatory protein RecX [Nevskiaceae bacterium]TAM30094.1 MAG: regulatory protein RecX [Nevskiaceae bacterium]
MRLLGRREHSAQQLSRKLKARGVEGGVADEVIDSLAESGWQSDPRYAEALIRSRIAQGHGPLRIRAELSVAGLDESLIREALDAADCDWTALAVETQARRFGGLPTTLAEKQKQYRALAQRGFTGEQIRVALKGDFDHEDQAEP